MKFSKVSCEDCGLNQRPTDKEVQNGKIDGHYLMILKGDVKSKFQRPNQYQSICASAIFDNSDAFYCSERGLGERRDASRRRYDSPLIYS